MAPEKVSAPHTDGQALREQPGIEFAPGLLLDIVRPADDRALPAIIWLHGGAWRMGDRSWRPDFARYFARSGFVMVSIDYTLSGDAVFPQQLLDVRAGIRWVRENAEAYGILADSIGLWGSSAGGHLAALAGLHGGAPAIFGEPEGAGSAAVQAVMDGYGAGDLLAPDQDNPPTAGLLGGSPGERRELATLASPARTAVTGAPPFLIMHGAADDLVPASQSIALYKALAAGGTDATLYLIDGFGHGFLNPAGLDEVAPGPRLDSGRLEADPTATAELRSTSGRAWPVSATFEVIEQFFREHLDSTSNTTTGAEA
ncbi:alpha/beta hydrolase [Microterricola viridarii]|nr:alpha/beta hydrolase [Microterricola viridarii]